MASPEWQRGFDDGYSWAKQHFNPQTGQCRHPDNFIFRGGGWHNGFGEGIITGRSEVIDKTFGKFKTLTYKNGKPEITR